MKTLSRTCVGAALAVLFATASTPARAIEYIESFDAKIAINQDTSISIEEKIAYVTDQAKHGIYRYIPFVLRSDEHLKFTHISDVAITDEFGATQPFSKEYTNEFVTFKIGDPNSTFTGVKTYVIKYRVHQALDRYQGSSQLYWDITGEGWQFPIKKTSAVISSAFADIDALECYSGVVGTDDHNCVHESETQQASFSYSPEIDYGENLTIAVALKQPNQLRFPRIATAISMKWFNIIGLIVALIPITIMFIVWYIYGRDFVPLSGNVFDQDESKPKRKKRLFERLRAPFVYEPLSISPGEAGIMLDEKADANDIVAEIIELARKKYVLIETVGKKSLFHQPDYLLKRLKPSDETLPPAQKHLQAKLFITSETITVSQLKGVFYAHFEKAKNILESSVTSNRFFTRPIKASRAAGMGLAIALNCCAGFALIVLTILSHQAWPVVLFVTGIPFTLVIGWNLVQKTALGTNAMLQAKGLKETLRLAKWRDEIKEKHLFIENIIPYSIALGVVDKLSKDIDDLGIKPPEYMSRGFSQGMTLHTFSSGFATSATSSLAYNPSSSGGSSGSGFSGGSSGGGGGGGGGGSW